VAARQEAFNCVEADGREAHPTRSHRCVRTDLVRSARLDVANLSHMCRNFVLGAANQWKSSRVCIHYITIAQNLHGWCATMLQIDPWVKAAECERAIRVIADPERRSVLISLRSLWVTLGNEESIFDASRQGGQVPKIAQIHAELLSSYKSAMN
jgi:hypothetical protein